MAIDITKSVNGQFYPFKEEMTPDNDIMGDRLAEFVSPAVISGHYVLDGQNVYVNSYITVSILFKCDKCLDPVKKELKIRFDATYSRDEGDYRYTGFVLDFREAVREQIILNLPSRVLCKADCKGLCPICGARLNEKDCGCIAEAVPKDNPFAALKDYFKD